MHKPPSTAWRPWTHPVHLAKPLSSPDFMKGLLAGRLWAGLWRKNSQDPTAPLGSSRRGRGRTCHFSYERKDESRAAPPLAWPLHGEKCHRGGGGVEKHTAGLQSAAGASKASSGLISREDTFPSEDAQSGGGQEQAAVPLDATLLKMGFRSKSPPRRRQ